MFTVLIRFTYIYITMIMNMTLTIETDHRFDFQLTCHVQQVFL